MLLFIPHSFAVAHVTCHDRMYGTAADVAAVCRSPVCYGVVLSPDGASTDHTAANRPPRAWESERVVADCGGLFDDDERVAAAVDCDRLCSRGVAESWVTLH